MTNRLEDLNRKPLTIGCRDVTLPQHDTLKIENRLLDGSLHVQTFGNSLKTITFDGLVSKANAEYINNAQSIVEELYFVSYDKTYRGIIREPVTWERWGARYRDATKRKFLGTMQFTVLEEVLS